MSYIYPQAPTYNVPAPSAQVPAPVAATTTSRLPSAKYPSWEYDLIRGLGGTVTNAKLIALNLWARAEGMPSDTNNPLAISSSSQLGYNTFGQTGNAPGLKVGNSPGDDVAPGKWNTFGAGGDESVLVFPTQAAGVAATIDFLNRGHSDIVAAFAAPSSSVADIANAITSDGGWGGDGAKVLAWSQNADVLTGKQITTLGASTGPQGKDAGRGPSSFTQCNSANIIIGEGGVAGVGRLNLLNPCQAKALVGGLLVATGLVTIALGFAVMFGAATLEKPSLTGGFLGSKSAAAADDVDPDVVAARLEWEKIHGMPWEQSAAGQRAAGQRAA